MSLLKLIHLLLLTLLLLSPAVTMATIDLPINNNAKQMTHCQDNKMNMIDCDCCQCFVAHVLPSALSSQQYLHMKHHYLRLSNTRNDHNIFTPLLHPPQI